MPDKKVKEREFGNLLKIEDNYPKYVVTMDEINMSQKGIKHMNIKDFLLSDVFLIQLIIDIAIKLKGD